MQRHSATHIFLDLFRQEQSQTPIFLTNSWLTLTQYLAVVAHGRPVNVISQASCKQTQTGEYSPQRPTHTGPVYGLNFGYGGNATTTVEDPAMLSEALEGLLAAIPRGEDSGLLPAKWVKGAMLLRAKSLARGFSGVRFEVVNKMIEAISKNIVPSVPSQGSISASGDLMPLAYIAFGLAGHRGVAIHPANAIAAKGETPCKQLMEPVMFEPRELLAIINGTSVSTAAAADTIAEAFNLLALTQVITAISCEALLGFRTSFSPFLHDVARPHPGQIEIASNLNRLLFRSTLVCDHVPGLEDPVDFYFYSVTGSLLCEEPIAGQYKQRIEGSFLKQDRYSLRTAPQWLGPVAEDFVAALQTLEIEFNSNTENPLVDSTGHVFHGGNFQASAVTNATEKVRDGLASLGKLLFAQQSELLNATTSRGLEPCLAPLDGPSLDGGLKALDIANAAYISELAWLANRVNHFSQSAEMHNQSLNSLALPSARQTARAVDLLTKMCANALFASLQAIDLRIAFHDFICEVYRWCVSAADEEQAKLFIAIVISQYLRNANLESRKRAHLAIAAFCGSDLKAAGSTRASILAKAMLQNTDCGLPHLVSEKEWRDALASQLDKKFVACMKRRIQISHYEHIGTRASSPTGSCEGLTARVPQSGPPLLDVWLMIRKSMRIPMWPGVRHARKHCEAEKWSRCRGTLAHEVTMIYDAIKDGSLISEISTILDRLQHSGN